MTVNVTIDGDSYTALATQTTADAYLKADSRYNAVWADLSTDNKGRALVTSYRRFLQLDWKGGSLPDSEQDVIDASILLAAQISQTPKVATGAGTGSNIKAAGAGPARVEFFKPTKGKIFTTDILALIRPFLVSSTSKGEAIGGDDTTIYGNPWDRSEGFA